MDYIPLTASATDADITAMVNEHVTNVDGNGKLTLPEGMPQMERSMVQSAKRQRDAQSALGKANDKLRTSEATNQVLNDNQLVLAPNLGLNAEEVTALNALASSDPEQYRLQMNVAEDNAKKKAREELDTKTKASVESAQNSHMANNRITVLQEFRATNPDLVITDDVLANDIPPRFMNKLNNGTYGSYGEYLTEVKTYLEKGMSIDEGNKGEEHSMSNFNGSSNSGRKAGDQQKKTDLSKISL